MFRSARIKLTLWYLVIILGITGTASGLFYLRTTSVIRFQFERIERRLEGEGEAEMLPPPPLIPQTSPRNVVWRHITSEDLDSARRMILLQLVAINSLVAVVVVVLGYVLSGITLRPIEKAMEEQKRFVGDAAHELKTPITALKTSLEVNLMDENLPKETRKILKENLEDIVSLEGLSQSLLKLARVDGQAIKLESIKVKGVVEQAVKHVKPLADKKRIEISVSRVEEGLAVKGERGSLVDLLVILLDNAVKYSRDGKKVRLKVKGEGGKVRFEVIDQGVGIDEKDLPHIFDRFYRTDVSRSKKEKDGYGLGLSVAKKIVAEHNGSIKVESQVKRGSVFTVIVEKNV